MVRLVVIWHDVMSYNKKGCTQQVENLSQVGAEVLTSSPLRY